ncbi:DUF983 domain-containing protein [Hirschia baltica]|uniref:Zinc-finger protein n=1 Tax=Hirschia baltica (strain ATCC 49814 / DSM 5838 / IFAM 1418) TaxID=582402 RepID=C6XIT1_HIRBI|nr:DUF983 domain-containing protein [Hirschia baltica]ACT59026.1 protein of unknown function DUF983 [Hirschia baltica ATCC 49814]
MTALPEPIDVTNSPDTMWQAIKRTIKGCCPNCGQGKLWAKYIKQVEHCDNCSAHLGAVRADDGPAWLTILIVGHIWSPILVLVTRYDIPMWFLFPALMFSALASCLVVLPFAKAIFIGAIWKSQAGDQAHD